MTDLPQYTIRESVRAKHVLLKMSLHDGLVVVVPRGFDVRQVPRILRGKRKWIDRAMQRIEQKKRVLEAESAWKLPERISLRAMNEEWMIEYRPIAASWVAARECDGQRLVLRGKIDNRATDTEVLRRWLLRKAHQHLPALLLSLADQHEFAVTKASVRFQKTRWGSCSTRGAISLNAKLLFLPRDLVDYVMIHELCHTVHHNHSADFWQLVQEHEPQANVLRRTLRDDAWRFVPRWLDGKVPGSEEMGATE